MAVNEILQERGVPANDILVDRHIRFKFAVFRNGVTQQAEESRRGNQRVVSAAAVVRHFADSLRNLQNCFGSDIANTSATTWLRNLASIPSLPCQSRQNRWSSFDSPCTCLDLRKVGFFHDA